jgi:hypothetical protein
MSKVLADQRRPNCIFYSECLDRTARTDGGFSCIACERYEPETEWYPPAHEFFGCLALARAVMVDHAYDEQQPQRLIWEVQEAITG